MSGAGARHSPTLAPRFGKACVRPSAARGCVISGEPDHTDETLARLFWWCGASSKSLILWRPRPELNRGTRFCRPLRNHSATWPCAAHLVAVRRCAARLYRTESGGQPCRGGRDLPWLSWPPPDSALPFLSRCRLTGGVHSPWDPPMIDFAAARRMMVDGQVRTSDVTDLRIIAAMLELPRERFVPTPRPLLPISISTFLPSEAAGDKPARHLLKPMVLAKLIQAAAVKADDRVLDVGCATGYSAALLRGSRARSSRWRRIRCWRGRARKSDGGGRGQRDGGDRAADRRLAARRPTTSFSSMGRPRRCPNAVPPAQGRGPAGRRGGPAPGGRAMLYCSVAGDVSGWPIFDAAAPAAAGLCCAAGLRLLGLRRLDVSFLQPLHSLSVARKHQARLFAKVSFSSRLPGHAPAPLWLTLVGSDRCGWDRDREARYGGSRGVCACWGGSGVDGRLRGLRRLLRLPRPQ